MQYTEALPQPQEILLSYMPEISAAALPHAFKHTLAALEDRNLGVHGFSPHENPKFQQTDSSPSITFCTYSVCDI